MNTIGAIILSLSFIVLITPFLLVRKSYTSQSILTDRKTKVNWKPVSKKELEATKYGRKHL